jgi:orotidine-5'-phosphate decarboxylase
MTRAELVAQIRSKSSFLCIGLDVDLEKIPPHLLQEEDPIFAFNKAIIDATSDLVVAYKPNTAFYEAHGSAGWKSLEKTIAYIPKSIFTIADAKRGDIGNTSRMYAKTFFEHMNCDSVTVAPYMGVDSVSPFLDFQGKWVILLALTSNPGSRDFQQLDCNGSPLYDHVITTSQQWGTPDNLMYVVGATHGEDIAELRRLAPDHFFLVPGVGAQGGDLDTIAQHGRNNDIGLLINSSRDIIYTSSGEDFATAARNKADAVVSQMQKWL